MRDTPASCHHDGGAGPWAAGWLASREPADVMLADGDVVELLPPFAGG